MTVLNVKNNNIDLYLVIESAKGEKRIIGNGPHIHSLYENLGTIERSILFYQKNHMPKEVDYFKAVRREYISLAASEIIYDPLRFKERLLNSQDKFITEELRVD